MRTETDEDEGAAGRESWVSAATHYKGFDQFGSVTFHLGAEPLVRALKDSPFELTYMPAHEAAEGFPFSADKLAEYGAIILSDLGANTLLLPPAVWMQGRPNSEPAQAHPRLDPRGRRADDDRRLFQLPGDRWSRALAGHGRGGRAAGHLPPV